MYTPGMSGVRVAVFSTHTHTQTKVLALYSPLEQCVCGIRYGTGDVFHFGDTTPDALAITSLAVYSSESFDTSVSSVRAVAETQIRQMVSQGYAVPPFSLRTRTLLLLK